MNLAAELTLAKLRNGGPGALAALCDRRGAAVLAYCRQAAGEDAAADLAAEAFALFRRAIQAPDALTGGGHAERLLRAVSRRAALAHLREALAGGDDQPRTPVCAAAGDDIICYLERTLAPTDHADVAAHVRTCDACSGLLQRLRAAEAAFGLAAGTPLPADVAQQILTALVHAAPVSAYGGSETAVRDEAVRLLAAEAGPATAEPAPSHREPPDHADDAPRTLTPPTPPPTPPVHARPQPAPAAHGNIPRRPRWRPAALGHAQFGPTRAAMLLRGTVKLVAVVAAAGAAGILLGLAVAELTGEDSAPAPPAPATSTPRAATATTAATTTKVSIEIRSATVRPAVGAALGSRLTVQARVANASDRAIRPEAPMLLVDEERVAAAPESSATARALLAPSIASGATAEGTLRYDVPSEAATDLAAARVRLRIAGKVIVLSPQLSEPATGG